MIEIKFDKKNKKALALYNAKEIGVCKYTEEDNTWNIIATKVEDDYKGRGIAKKLVECIIENAKKEGKKLIADCTYANKVINSFCG